MKKKFDMEKTAYAVLAIACFFWPVADYHLYSRRRDDSGPH